MAKKKAGPAAEAASPPGGYCGIESVLTVDARGQIVLPSDVRKKAGIGSGDKLVLASFTAGNCPCCLFLVKANELAGMVQGFLGPVLGELTGKRA